VQSAKRDNSRHLSSHSAFLQSSQVREAATAIPHRIILQIFETEVLQEVVIQRLQVERQVVVPETDAIILHNYKTKRKYHWVRHANKGRII
jgi:hypothetical protein